MNINFRSVAFSVVACVCASVLMNSAAAGGPIGEKLQQQVGYADLDLNRPEGVAALYTRVHAAAVDVCSPTESRELALGSTQLPCIAAATARAVMSINNAALTAYSNARTGRGEPALVAVQP